MTIEETRQAVKESARIVAAGLDHPDSIMKAADAYAMAAVEEAWEAAKQDLVWTHAKIPSAASIALRKRIECLGGKDAP